MRKKRGKRRISAKVRPKRRRKAVRSRKRRAHRKRRTHRIRERPPAAEQPSYQRGFKDGLKQSREAFLEEFLPHDVLIPDLTPEEAMAAGLAALRARGRPILFPPVICDEIIDSMNNRRPYSFVRLGDGELMTLAQGKVLPDAEIQRIGSFLPYAGVKIPDLAARDELLHALRNASLLGVPLSRLPYFQPLFLRILRAYGIDIASLRLTSSTMNYSIYDEGYMMKLLQGRKILLIGNAAGPLGAALKKLGIEVAGTVSPVRGVNDLKRVVTKAASFEFDLALVAAGVAAVPICVRIAERTGKAAMDIGHLADRMAGIPSMF